MDSQSKVPRDSAPPRQQISIASNARPGTGYDIKDKGYRDKCLYAPRSTGLSRAQQKRSAGDARAQNAEKHSEALLLSHCLTNCDALGVDPIFRLTKATIDLSTET